MRSKIEDLRMIIPFSQFKIKAETKLEEAKKLLEFQLSEEAEYSELERLAKVWYEEVMNLLKESFNNPLNHIEYQFSHDSHTLTRTSNSTNSPLPLRLKNKKDELLRATYALKAKTNILSVCEAIINFNSTNIELINKLNNGQRLSYILQLLYKLPSDSYYPINEILKGNGLVIDSNEAYDLANELYQSGMIELYGKEFVQLNIKGKLWVEKNLSTQQKTVTVEQKEKGKIFISHATKDKEIVSKFCDLILGNGLNIPPNKIFNTSHQGTNPKTGQDFRLAIKDELINAKVVLQFISPAYKNSEACLNEMGAAWVLSDNVKPLIVEKGEYEVGFIHSTTQQAQLHNEEHLFRLTDELQDEGIFEGRVKIEVLTKKVKEFISWLNSSNSMIEPKINIVDVNKYEKDIEVIRTYLKEKRLVSISFDGLVKYINPKYSKDYILSLIEENPNVFTRAEVLSKEGIKLVLSSQNDLISKLL